jgi:integrase
VIKKIIGGKEVDVKGEEIKATQCAVFTCPPEKDFDRLPIGGGAYLQVTKTGGRYWATKYYCRGKRETYRIGTYAKFTLSEARAERNRIKDLASQGIDPNTEKRTMKSLDTQSYETFGDCAKNFIATHPQWSSDRLKQVNSQLNGNILPYIGWRPMKDIKGTEILSCIQRMVKRKAIQSAHKTLAVVSGIYETVALDGIPNATIGIKARLPKAIRGNYPAITEPKRFAELLRAMDGYGGSIEIKSALLIAPILFQRPKNLRTMRWREIDTDSKLWTIKSKDLKREAQEKLTGEDHLVPLPLQVIEILEKLKPITGGGEYVFPNERDKDRPFSVGAIQYALTSIKFVKEQSFHGFRASGRTMASEVLRADDRHLEAQMSHKIKGDAHRGAYNRTRFIEQRREVIQLWANYLDGLKAGADVLPFKSKAG